MKSNNAIQRSLDVQRLLAEHYEPGRQDRCKLQVFRNIIQPIYHISEGTFFRYLKVKEKPEGNKENDGQLKLFD
jgi:hypothetical protein